MNQHPRWLRTSCVIIGVAIIFLCRAIGQAQVFRLGSWDGALEGQVDFSRVDTKSVGTQRTIFENMRSEERLTLRNTGAYVFNPRLVTLSVGGTFGLSQEWLTTDSTTRSQEGTLWGYDAFTSFFPEHPYSLNLFANRNQFFLSRELAGRTKVETENRGGTLLAKDWYISSIITLYQDVRKEETATAESVARRNERRNVLLYEGQRGWVDSEMGLRYEFLDLTDEIFPTLSYQSHDGSFNYSLDFGEELNRHWDSRVRAFSRTGFSRLTSYTVDEKLRFDHTDRLRTEYRYLLLHTDVPGGVSTTHTGAFTLRHQLYESLTTMLLLDANLQTLPGGEKDIYHSRLDVAYTKHLPWRGILTAAGGAGFDYENDRFGVTESFVSQETHTATTPLAFAIALTNPLVIIPSVVVTKVAVGPLPVGCIPPSGPPTPLLLNRDYTLRTTGDITEIVPISCAGVAPGINPGDTIAVDYQFSVSPSLSFTTLSRRGSVSLDYRWIRPYFFHDRLEQTLLSGNDGRFLDTRESNTAGTELRYDGQRVRASVLGEVRRVTSRRQSFDSVRSVQFVSLSISPRLTLSLNADEEQFDFKSPQPHISRTLTGKATATYTLAGNLFADALGGIRWIKDTLLPTERLIESTLRVRWLLRKLEVDPTVEFFDRRRGDTVTKEYRGMLHVIRRF